MDLMLQEKYLLLKGLNKMKYTKPNWTEIFNDDRPLTDETLEELGFEKFRTCYAIKISNDVILRCAVGDNFTNKTSFVTMNVMPSVYYKTVGSVKMLIEALKGDE